MTDAERERLMWNGLTREIAHRMGTPLSALFGWLELLPGSKDPARVIEEMSGNLLQLTAISDRLGQIGQPTKFEAVSIADIFNSVVEYVRPRLPSGDPGIEFDTEISDDPGVEVNRPLLEWTIEHLIRNSVDAVDRNRGKIDLRARKMDKDIIFVLDKSGSMSGQKMSQLKLAFREIINQLPGSDSLNVVMFDSNIRTYEPELFLASQENKEYTINYIENIDAGGSYDSILHPNPDTVLASNRFALQYVFDMPLKGIQGDAPIFRISESLVNDDDLYWSLMNMLVGEKSSMIKKMFDGKK